MRWTSYLPTSPEPLARLEWWVWVIAAFCGVAAILLGFVARGIGQYRGQIVVQSAQQHLDKALSDRDEKARQLEEKSKELEQVARQAQQKAAELEARQAARRLLPPQRAELLRLLRARPTDAARIQILAVAGDAEAHRYAEELTAVLRETGWNVGDGVLTVANIVASGVVITISDARRPPSGAVLLLQSLKSVGVTAGGHNDPSFDPHWIRVVVGNLPR